MPAFLLVMLAPNIFGDNTKLLEIYLINQKFIKEIM